MREERKGKAIEKWDEVTGRAAVDTTVQDVTKDPKALGSQMRNIEDVVEQNDNNFDGIINNAPASETPVERAVKEEEKRRSVIGKLKENEKIMGGQYEYLARNIRCDVPVR